MLDERDEALEQAVDFIQQSAERWHNRLTYKNLWLGERYVKGELEILVLLEEVGIGGEKCAAVLHRIPVGRPETDGHRWQVLRPVGEPAKISSPPGYDTPALAWDPAPGRRWTYADELAYERQLRAVLQELAARAPWPTTRYGTYDHAWPLDPGPGSATRPIQPYPATWGDPKRCRRRRGGVRVRLQELAEEGGETRWQLATR